MSKADADPISGRDDVPPSAILNDLSNALDGAKFLIQEAADVTETLTSLYQSNTRHRLSCFLSMALDRLDEAEEHVNGLFREAVQ